MYDLKLLKDRLARVKEVSQKEGLDGLIAGVKRYKTYYNPFKSFFLYKLNKIKYRDSMASPDKIIYIDPDKVKYRLRNRFLTELSVGYTFVFSGNWDINKKPDKENKNNNRYLTPFEDYYIYRSFKKRFLDGVSWEETDYYKKRISKIRSGETNEHHPRYGTEEKFHQRLSQLDELYKEMKEEGYKTQKQLNKEKEKDRSNVPLHQKRRYPNLNEVMVNIGRDGGFIFEEGRHRFSIARLLGLDSIPVRVFVRHEEWQELRSEVAGADDVGDLSDRAVDFLDHPDMQDISKHLTDYKKR